MSALASGWTDVSSIGYLTVFAGVLLGSLVPVVPTGAVVGAAAAVATTTDDLALSLVLGVAIAGALLGDLATFGAGRVSSEVALRWLARRQSPQRLAGARRMFAARGWQLIVVGRLLPAGRIPVLLAAAALEYPWPRLIPASALACALWGAAYALLGVATGGLFDDPVVASVIAAVLVLAGTAAVALVARRRGGLGGARGDGP